VKPFLREVLSEESQDNVPPDLAFAQTGFLRRYPHRSNALGVEDTSHAVRKRSAPPRSLIKPR